MMQSKVILNAEGIEINGEYKILLCASLFYFRIPRGLWQKRIDDLLAAGYNTIDVYFPWNFHEQDDAGFDYSGEKDVSSFLQLCSSNGLYVVARPGPYICSEWDGGGLPSRICGADYQARTADAAYLAEVKKWFASILGKIAPYQIDNGGSVILLQLENELDFYDCGNPQAYISQLRDFAREAGISVPLFCCSGQGGTRQAGGLTQGVYPAFNFYPRISDGTFDVNCRAYNELCRAHGLPLLISETGREHSLLRREMAAGAKLLGAYNQVGGSNFGFTQSINNWGKNQCESIITTQYDFCSMISTLGDYNAEAREARLLYNTIATFGDKLARATAGQPITGFSAEFEMPKALNCLNLYGGGRLLCLPNLTDKTGIASVCLEQGGFRTSVPGYGALLLPLDLPLNKWKIDGKIEYSNAEILHITENCLTFYTDGSIDIRLTINNISATVTQRNAVVGGVRVVVLTRAEAIGSDAAANGLDFAFTDERSVTAVEGGKMSKWSPKARKINAIDGTFERNNLSAGTAVYDINTGESQGLFVCGAADIMTVKNGGKFIETVFMTSNCKFYPSDESGLYRLKVEKWGHSNFDDFKRRSLRIQSKKGVCGLYEVKSRQPLDIWRFALYENPVSNWPQRLDLVYDEFAPKLNINSWNSTRQPLNCTYSIDIEICQFEQLALELEEGTAECAVYVDGSFAGEFHPHDRVVFLTDAVVAGQKHTLTLLCRKRNWCEAVGTARLLSLKKADAVMSHYAANELLAAQPAKQIDFKFPLKIKAGQERLLELDLDGFDMKCCYGVIKGTGFKATVMLNGRIIARLLSKDFPVVQAGGDFDKFLIPSVWRGGKLRLYVEATAKNSCIKSFALEYPRH